MKVIDALPEDLSLMIRLKAKAQPGVQPSKSLLQPGGNVFVQLLQTFGQCGGPSDIWRTLEEINAIDLGSSMSERAARLENLKVPITLRLAPVRDSGLEPHMPGCQAKGATYRVARENP